MVRFQSYQNAHSQRYTIDFDQLHKYDVFLAIFAAERKQLFHILESTFYKYDELKLIHTYTYVTYIKKGSNAVSIVILPTNIRLPEHSKATKSFCQKYCCH